ncbi:hypothetical protein HDG34_003258 [Paraburkholderia sp. HC6.4b]|uniref:hypothetical protein n=1 Tax=unclassified Paraburkholderia TaxID=2615204 RepID=UPI00160D4F90|nr:MULTISPECIES: hypothetical protein [unclassified Paraburkholderia]MBB5409317.1 hypothetical protein [Paraburkholderia sp. HC6.4b]MBB5451045.1 hypothetical protein [Paraburkholderia sp. Kb1A]
MKKLTMKKISFALLASLFVAGAASAQTTENGIVMTHDDNVAAQIVQHARDVQAQPPVVDQDAQPAHEGVPSKGAHHHHKKHPAKRAQGPAGE